MADLQKQIARTKQNLAREKQFNRQVDINATLRGLQKELGDLNGDE